MDDQKFLADAVVPTTGRRLALPDGPIFHLHRANQSDYEIGEFRAWAGYRNLGADEATDDLAHFQHVLSFGATETAGRTGVHAHLAHAHIVIPTSGCGVFSYDGVVTRAVAGTVIVQHGGTVHDQFDYSFAGGSQAENRTTPLAIDAAAGLEARSFGFLELFVPKTFANIEIVPPGEVTDDDQRTAWRHPYHAAGARFAIQPEAAPAAAYRPLAAQPGLEARDCGTWAASGRMVATWFVRPATGAPGQAIDTAIPGEAGGVDIVHMIAGSATFARTDGGAVRLETGDTLSCSQGQLGAITGFSPDLRLVRFLIAARVQRLRQPTPDEIRQLESLGPRVITGREIRPEGDTRPVNFLRDDG